MKRYAEAFGLERDSFLPALAGRLAVACLPALRNGVMPMGDDGETSPARRFHGSAERTLSFWEATGFALAVCGRSLTPAKRMQIASARDHAAACFRDRFFSGGIWCEDWPGGERSTRLPSRLFGRCDRCGEPGELVRREEGYLHPDGCEGRLPVDADREEPIPASEELRRRCEAFMKERRRMPGGRPAWQIWTE